MNKQTISIEGLIGAGKSTVLAKLREAFACDTETEPIEAWTLLDQFYTDQESHAFAFEVQVLCSYKHVRYQRPGLVMERSAESALRVFAPMLQANKKLSSNGLFDLECMANALGLRSPDVVVFLDLDVLTCMERLRWRNRDAERRAVTVEYLEQLRQFYLDYLEFVRRSGRRVIMVHVDRSHTPDDIAASVHAALRDL